MFHGKPLLLIGFFILTPLVVIFFGKMGWGTNNIFPAIIVTAAILGGGSWVLKRMGRLVPNKATGFHFLMTGETDLNRGPLVRYQPQHLQHYGYPMGVQVSEEDEFEEDEFEEDELEEDEFEEDELEEDEFEEDELEEDEFEEDEFEEDEYVEEEQLTSQLGFSPPGPNGTREQRATHPPMNARPRMQGQLGITALMRLAHDLVFDPDKVLSGRVSVFGLPNSGKSNLIAKLCEELGRLYVPFVLADTEDEYSQLVDEGRTWLKNGYTAGSPTVFDEGATLPPHFIPVDQAGAYYFGKMVLEQGFQIVLNLESYETEEEAALVMCEIVRGMRDWEQEQAPNDRVSCFFILEEAATWLPQNTAEIKERLSDKTLALLQTTLFNTVVRKGRKRGLGFIFATQRPAEIDKRAMKSSWRFLMWQTEKNDLDVYEEMCPRIDRAKVQRFIPGEAVVMGPGILTHTRIDHRRSPDCAKTPGLESVRRRYGNGQRQRFHTQDLAQYLEATASQSTRPLKPKAAELPLTQPEQEGPTEGGDPRVVAFVHPSQQPKANSEQQLAWGCAVLHYLNEKGEPWTETSVRKPRAELRDLALALGVWKSGAAEIIGGGSRAERIKAEVEQISGPRMLELLRLATQAQASYQTTTPVLASQAES